jgi:hypothetical protein
MPRHRLALRAYASFHGQILVGPHADPNQVEHEAWALLRQQCAHLDRARLMPVRRFFPHGGLVLKVISADTMLPVAVASIHALLVQLDGRRASRGRTCRRSPVMVASRARDRRARPATRSGAASRAIASSTACSGLMPSAATRWTARPHTFSCYTRLDRNSWPCRACCAIKDLVGEDQYVVVATSHGIYIVMRNDPHSNSATGSS